jgi:hypothetical protein
VISLCFCVFVISHPNFPIDFLCFCDFSSELSDRFLVFLWFLIRTFRSISCVFLSPQSLNRWMLVYVPVERRDLVDCLLHVHIARGSGVKLLLTLLICLQNFSICEYAQTWIFNCSVIYSIERMNI